MDHPLFFIKKIEFLLSLEKSERLAVIINDYFDHWYEKIKALPDEKSEEIIFLLYKLSDTMMMENSSFHPNNDYSDSEESEGTKLISHEVCQKCGKTDCSNPNEEIIEVIH